MISVPLTNLQEEERLRAQTTLEAELEAQRERLKKETEGVRNDVERQFAEEIGSLREKIISLSASLEEAQKEKVNIKEGLTRMEEYVVVLEERLSGAEAREESLLLELDTAKKELADKSGSDAELATAKETQGGSLGEDEVSNNLEVCLNIFCI